MIMMRVTRSRQPTPLGNFAAAAVELLTLLVCPGRKSVSLKLYQQLTWRPRGVARSAEAHEPGQSPLACDEQH